MRSFCLIALWGFGLSASANSLSTPLKIWVNDGLDKVTRDELRFSSGQNIINSHWDGKQIQLRGAQNEVLQFNMILESPDEAVHQIHVEFNQLQNTENPKLKIETRNAGKKALFNWVGRPIELFYVRYLKIKGTSALFYESYDERHLPRRFRRPYEGEGIGKGKWEDRPDHDKEYPDIAVPLELHPTFSVAGKTNQSIWADIWIPRTQEPGNYQGTVKVFVKNKLTEEIPVQLKVLSFRLPDVPSANTMLYIGHPDIALRYTGNAWPEPNTREEKLTQTVRDRHFQLAKRHGISLIDENKNGGPEVDNHPLMEWLPRLNGSMFTAKNGYEGPGEGVGNGVFSIGTYGQWSWKTKGENIMHLKLTEWARWFQAYSPKTETFLYLIDESTDTAQIERWAKWIKNAPKPANQILSFATLPLNRAIKETPSLDIAATWFTVGDQAVWKKAVEAAKEQKKLLYFYNGKRPATGSFAIEDDGVALRELVWVQKKFAIHRWFYWEGTYYNNFQGGRGQTNVFETASTYGGLSGKDPIKGETGWNYSNGDGVLFYPGTDTVFPKDSYGVLGPFASLRMKTWRRGLQDAHYIELAKAKNPKLTQQLIQSMVPKALWEYGISNPADPTWIRTKISWSDQADDWEKARSKLTQIIQANESEIVLIPTPVIIEEDLKPTTPSLKYRIINKLCNWLNSLTGIALCPSQK